MVYRSVLWFLFFKKDFKFYLTENQSSNETVSDRILGKSQKPNGLRWYFNPRSKQGPRLVKVNVSAARTLTHNAEAKRRGSRPVPCPHGISPSARQSDFHSLFFLFSPKKSLLPFFPCSVPLGGRRQRSRERARVFPNSNPPQQQRTCTAQVDSAGAPSPTGRTVISVLV
jgi:hypothetical protein